MSKLSEENAIKANIIKTLLDGQKYCIGEDTPNKEIYYSLIGGGYANWSGAVIRGNCNTRLWRPTIPTPEPITSRFEILDL